MADQLYIPLCSFVMRYTGLLPFSPFIWDTKHNRVSLRYNSDLRKHHTRFLIFYNTIYVSTALIQIIWQWPNMPKISGAQTLSKIYVCAVIYSVPSSIITILKAKEIANLFNASLDILATFKKPDHLAGSRDWFILKCVTKMLSITSYSLLFYFINEFVNPCFPKNAAYWLSPQCRSQIAPGFLKEGISWNLDEIMGRMVVVILSFLSAQSLCCIQYALLCIILIQAHMITTMISRFDSEIQVTTQNPRRIDKAFLLYRKIQGNMKIFREIYSDVVLLSIAGGGMLLQIQSIYVVVTFMRSPETDSVGSLIVVLSGWLAMALAVTILFVYGKLAKIFEDSEGVLEGCKEYTGLMRDKRFLAYFKSCPTVKVHFGKDNFVEPDTPVNMENFVIDQTTSLLLI